MQIKQWKHKIEDSATLAINQRVLKLRAENKTIAHFGFGESPFPVHATIQQSLAENKHQKSYLPVLGLPLLRTTIAQFHNQHFNTHFNAENIAVGPGSKELIFQALFLLQGDVFIPVPSWVSYAPQAHLLEKPVHFIHTTFDNQYQLTPQELNDALQRSSCDQKILILNNPSNPTGQVYSPESLAALATVCKAHNVVIISDEIYALVHFNKTITSLCEYCPERVIVTNGLSKAFSAGGYRLGYLATQNTAFLQALSTVISETFSCVSSPIQFAAVAAFQNDPAIMQYTQECTNIHHACLQFVGNRLRQMGLNCLEAQGGFYLFPDFYSYQESLKNKHGISTSETLCTILIEEAGIAFLPGEHFGYLGAALAVRAAVVDYNGEALHQSYLKLGAVAFKDKLPKLVPSITLGLERLEKWLKGLGN